MYIYLFHGLHGLYLLMLLLTLLFELDFLFLKFNYTIKASPKMLSFCKKKDVLSPSMFDLKRDLCKKYYY